LGIVDLLLGQEVLDHPPNSTARKPPPPPGLTIDDNLLVLILAIFLGFILYTVISKKKTPI
jgi:hypothetical protein